ncbi:MAG: TonB-dependent receptor domain-containing protein [Chloroflexota bacterium]
MKNSIIGLIFILAASSLFARTIKGVVSGRDPDGAKTPLQKASVYEPHSKKGTLTDSLGRFELEIPNASHSIICSYTGHLKDTIALVTGQEFYEITLDAAFKTGTVNVTGEMPAALISRSDPIKSETVTLAGLKKAACCNLGESFQTNPSVDVNYSDAATGAKQIQLLGLAGIYSQILVEKIPNLRGVASTFGLNYIPGPWMESIQISKGAASVASGYESITGQINVEYKKPESSDPLHFNAYADETGRFETSLNARYKLSDKLSTMALLHGNIMESSIDRNGDSFMDHPMAKQLNFINRWKYESGLWESMSGAKVLVEERQGGQANYFERKDPNAFGIEIKTNRYEFFTKNGFIFPGERFKSLGTILSFTSHDQGSMYGKNMYDAEQKSFYANVIYQTSFGPMQSKENKDAKTKAAQPTTMEPIHSLNFGASYMYDSYDEMYRDSTMKRIESVPGAFLEYTFTGIPRLAAILGVRVDENSRFGTFFTPRAHLRYEMFDGTTIRLSGGKGYHTSNIYSENSNLFASSRKFIVEGNLKAEEAWNYGANLTSEFELAEMPITFNAEYYRTDFVNQVTVDMERDPGAVYFYNLEGKSYSNSAQVDVMIELYPGLTTRAAYRINDVWSTIGGKLTQKPLISPHKGFLNLAYTTVDDDWNFDFTAEYNSSGRLPESIRELRGETFPGFALFHGQITKKFGTWDLYLGAENITDYKQPNPIIGAENPYGKYFDSSMIWGPVGGRKVYMGFRYNVFN